MYALLEMTEPVSVRIHHSTRPSKKLMAVFTLENAHTRTVHFGAVGASDGLVISPYLCLPVHTFYHIFLGPSEQNVTNVRISRGLDEILVHTS